jgi:60 kDa SS-A/Ro ribonucleoprotein
MKDMPALLCAVLSIKSPGLMCEIFDRVIDNAKMLQNFVQMIRSGAVGRTSLGSAPKRMVRNWLDTRSDEQVFRSAVGQDPSLADIVKMLHPKPKTPARAALYAYLIGRTRRCCVAGIG